MKLRKDEEDRFRLPFLTLGGVAALAGLDRDTLWLLAQKGVLTPSDYGGGKMLFRREDISKWLRENGYAASKWP